MCAGSPSPGAGSAPHTPSQWSSGSMSVERAAARPRSDGPRRSARPSRRPSTRRAPGPTPGRGSAAARARRPRCSATNAARGKAGSASSAAALAAISSSTSRTATMVTPRPLPEVGIAQRHGHRPGAFERSRAQPASPRPSTSGPISAAVSRASARRAPAPMPSWASTIPPGSSVSASSMRAARVTTPVVRVDRPAHDLEIALSREVGRVVSEVPPRNPPPRRRDAGPFERVERAVDVVRDLTSRRLRMPRMAVAVDLDLVPAVEYSTEQRRDGARLARRARRTSPSGPPPPARRARAGVPRGSGPSSNVSGQHDPPSLR